MFLRQFAVDCWDLGYSGSSVWGVPDGILFSVGLLGTLRVPHLGSRISRSLSESKNLSSRVFHVCTTVAAHQVALILGCKLQSHS